MARLFLKFWTRIVFLETLRLAVCLSRRVPLHLRMASRNAMQNRDCMLMFVHVRDYKVEVLLLVHALAHASLILVVIFSFFVYM